MHASICTATTSVCACCLSSGLLVVYGPTLSHPQSTLSINPAIVQKPLYPCLASEASSVTCVESLLAMISPPWPCYLVLHSMHALCTCCLLSSPGHLLLTLKRVVASPVSYNYARFKLCYIVVVSKLLLLGQSLPSAA